MTDRMKLIVELIKLANDNPSHYHHPESNTHLYWAPWMVPFFARGADAWSDEAFFLYMAKVNEMLARASDRDLEMWLSESKKWVTTK